MNSKEHMLKLLEKRIRKGLDTGEITLCELAKLIMERHALKRKLKNEKKSEARTGNISTTTEND